MKNSDIAEVTLGSICHVLQKPASFLPNVLLSDSLLSQAMCVGSDFGRHGACSSPTWGLPAYNTRPCCLSVST